LEKDAKPLPAHTCLKHYEQLAQDCVAAYSVIERSIMDSTIITIGGVIVGLIVVFLEYQHLKRERSSKLIQSHKKFKPVKRLAITGRKGRSSEEASVFTLTAAGASSACRQAAFF